MTTDRYVPYSSMFFDEDGDLAHEFYEECRTKSEQGSVRWTMRRLLHNGIRPQVYHTLYVHFMILILNWIVFSSITWVHGIQSMITESFLGV